MTIEATIAPYLRESRESETLLINQLSLSLESEKTVYKFGFGQSPFPVPKHVVRAMEKAAHRKEYMPVQGYAPLREAISEMHGHHESRNWSASEIIVGTGSKILIYCVMASFMKADVLLPGPSWVSYEPQAELAGHDVHWLPTSFENKWKISASDIEHTCRNLDPAKPKLMVLNYPSNPTGQTYTADELASLAVALKKYGVLVIADEIYSFLTFKGKEAHLEDFYPEGVITSSGLSKWCGAGGWRLGYLRIPPNLAELQKRIIGVASETYSSATSPVQIAATEAYSKLTFEQGFLASQKHALEYAANLATSKLQAAGVQVHMSDGGFYIFPNFDLFKDDLAANGIDSSQKLTESLLLDAGVALLPGTAFGMSPDSLTARLAYVDFDGQAVLNGEDYAVVFARLEAGIDAITQWLESISSSAKADLLLSA